MKKAEIVAVIEQNVTEVLSTTQVDYNEATDIRRYIAHVLIVDPALNTARFRNIGFYVRAEGQESEEAYWEGAPLTKPQENPVVTDIKQVLQAHIDAGNVDTADIVSINTERKYAEVVGYKDNGDGTVTEIRGVIFYAPNGQYRFRRKA